MRGKNAADGVLWYNVGMKPRAILALSAIAVAMSSAAEVRVGAVDWDCSVPRGTFFGNATANSLGPEHWRSRTPYYAKVVGRGLIDIPYRTLAEYEVELQYAIDAGLDYLAYCWYDRTPNLAPDPDHACSACGHLQEITYARQLHAKSALREKIHLCAILVAAHPYSDVELTDLALEMREPWYEKVDGRPLVYYAFATKGEVALRLRGICRKVGAADPYVVFMNGDPKVIARLGAEKVVDAACAYGNAVSGTYREMVDSMLERNARRASSGIPVVPHMTTGWDPRPRIKRPTPWTKGSYAPDWTYDYAKSEEDFKYAAAKLRDWMQANASSCPTGHVLAFAWNEFEEGGWICPTIGADGNPDTRRVKWFKSASDILKSHDGK